MDFAILFQLLVSSLAMGSIYGAVALGFTMIWNAAAIVNFAQGELVMVGAFLGLLFVVILGWPFPLAILATMVGAALVGLVMDRLVVRPVRKAEFWATVVATLGTSIFLQNLARILWGPEPRSFPSVLGDQPVTVGFIRFIPQSLWILVIVMSLVLLQDVFFRRTLLGRVLRAVSWDKETASLLGISVNQMIAITFAISSALAAVAGVLLAPVFYVTYDMGLAITIKAFAATIVGGFGSSRGAIVGGLLIGVVESFGALFISSDYRDAIVFAFVILVLAIKPTGVLPTAESI